MVDRNGTIVNTYEYDEWGNIRISNEMVSNPFKYAGEVYDEETGLYYLRARYYDPKFGRFINEDTYEGQINDVLSLNGYSYCNNNPLIYSDPSGHSPVAIVVPAAAGAILISGGVVTYIYITSPGSREKVKQAARDIEQGAKDTATAVKNDAKAAKKWADKQVAKAKKKLADSSKNKSGNSSSQKGKDTGKSKGAGNTKVKEPASPGSMQKKVEKGQAPKEVDRVDKPHVPGQKPHVHFKNGTSLNNDGTVHDVHNGIPNPSDRTAYWLKNNGWKVK